MKPLPIVQQLMIWFCLLPPEKYTSVLKKSAYIGFTTAMIVSQIIISAASIAFIIRNDTINFDRTLSAYSVLFYALGKIYTALVALYVRHGFAMIFKNLKIIYDASKIILTAIFH